MLSCSHRSLITLGNLLLKLLVLQIQTGLKVMSSKVKTVSIMGAGTLLGFLLLPLDGMLIHHGLGIHPPPHVPDVSIVAIKQCTASRDKVDNTIQCMKRAGLKPLILLLNVPAKVLHNNHHITLPRYRPETIDYFHYDHPFPLRQCVISGGSN